MSQNVIWCKNIKKNHGLLKFASCPPLGGRPDEKSGRPWNLIHSPPCRTPCRRLFIHEVFFGPLGLHLRVGCELDGLCPFDQWELLDYNCHGSSVLCVKWPLNHGEGSRCCDDWCIEFVANNEMKEQHNLPVPATRTTASLVLCASFSKGKML